MSTPAAKHHILEEKPYLLAIFITLALIAWMASGTGAAQVQLAEKTTTEVALAKVQVTPFIAQNIKREMTLYGRTEPDRQATLKAQLSGLVTKVLATRGSKVSKDQPLVELALNDLTVRLSQAKALLNQRKIQYNGAKSLSKKGYQAQAQLAEANANLAGAKAQLKSIELDIEHAVIRAPFDGVLNERFVEVGDYVGPGDDVALIADLNPLVIKADVTESQVHQLTLGQRASSLMLNKTIFEGDIRYISSISHQGTNTFKVEVAIPNENYALRAGFSTELSILLDEVPAIKISPALLALDEKGNVGVKTVSENKVIFTPIQMVKSENDGVWLTGLGDNAQVISLGQGLVREGDSVEAISVSSTKTAVTDSAGRL
ncbi:MAG: multidrug efflux system membrane fusion protein [Alteromonadaceae bacterium]|jgi:multidrug efflux system membrane fusion protein